ncbi:3-oxo-5-alpha-steroid_4-dehydrogenase [Hexamita inflata]|uniref:3-oxo-5-alpha-steroid 4-dehydrogenase n=1 Tax=Hexamita inflata TaxID=28002 RepID=A0AA86TF72_9EUKA|nr:3-oxo-5-alpha-steroid 4-dehydrogenase [Hexamita inflata]CAI9965054.1 3-oxo-5-alpha-steroid 4-dehydrogenase [Hexamita inflata]
MPAFYYICYIWLTLALAAFTHMCFDTKKYGRHSKDTQQHGMNNKVGWMIMESPSFFMMLYYAFKDARVVDSYIWILFAAWLLHYFNRTFIFSLRLKPTPKKMPYSIAIMSIIFNFINGGLNGYYLSKLANPADYQLQWLQSPQFIIGAVIFISGMYINMRSDSMLIALRKPGETGYKLPRGFLFEYLASPNLFGEIIEWLGYFLAGKNIAAFTFFIWTMAGLVPRSQHHYQWSKQQFENYPAKRKILIPFIY